MLLALGVLITILGCIVLQWARPKPGREQPRLVRSEFGSMSICILIIILWSAGLSLVLKQFI